MLGAIDKSLGGRLLFDLMPRHGVWTTVELREAMRVGYTIQNIRRIYHFAQRSQDLYKDYMETFVRMRWQAKAEGNDGLQFCLKLCLNSLWGRIGLNMERSQRQDV